MYWSHFCKFIGEDVYVSRILQHKNTGCCLDDRIKKGSLWNNSWHLGKSIKNAPLAPPPALGWYLVSPFNLGLNQDHSHALALACTELQAAAAEPLPSAEGLADEWERRKANSEPEPEVIQLQLCLAQCVPGTGVPWSGEKVIGPRVVSDPCCEDGQKEAVLPCSPMLEKVAPQSWFPCWSQASGCSRGSPVLSLKTPPSPRERSVGS